MAKTIKTDKALWEILVPTIHPNGKPIRTRYHRVWDKKIREIASGLTILNPAKGHWISPDGELFVEKMIPVRILATDDEMNKIVDITLTYYSQKAVLAYKISESYILRYADV